MNNAFKDLYSLSEASKLWHVEESVLRRHILNSKFKAGIDAKKFGKQWIITKQAMEREYGVLNKSKDFVTYSDKKMDDVAYYVSNCILQYSEKYHLDYKRVVQLFDKYNIIRYIYDCYDYLHLGNDNDVVKELASRTRRKINYVQ